ncbi:F-box protein [Aspergillus saccharolyticus JOP 1030-1]|uniref:F-box domain protein n=1 Tax=Aspergillus saccharolyticus JOP 1030-1 TaxID=1450539 RepID=A0A318ZTH7_9EURO|nr:F-box domain protein [Aspergillus saccharolyticus JOP 1030-1]PYH49974.1 F-box domain protein [Aspergillus saccharolyticus JOP 1030-1]
MSDRISSLPLEIVLHILSYLPFKSLLAFGETCHTNFESHTLCLSCLRLGVFEKRSHAAISLLRAGWLTPEQMLAGPVDKVRGDTYKISIIQPTAGQTAPPLICKTPLRTKDIMDHKKRIRVAQEAGRPHEHTVREQNRIFAQVVNRYGQGLRKLEFMAYDLDNTGATALATNCQYILTHLALRFDHSHIRDGSMRPGAWSSPAPGGTAWNSLIGIGQLKHMGPCALQSLVLERAGITPWQLMMLVKRNPRLKVLKLRTCRGVQQEFLDWLGGIESELDESNMDDDNPAPGAKLEVLWLENCHNILLYPVEYPYLPDGVCDLGLEWVRRLNSLQSLSFSESSNLPPEFIKRANDTLWRIPEVILPFTSNGEKALIEVDPLST